MPVNDDYFYYADGSGYPYDEYEYDEDDYYEDEEEMCGEINCTMNAIDQCQCCGMPLCHMHSEIGAGFCRGCPTQDWIDEQQERLGIYGDNYRVIK